MFFKKIRKIWRKLFIPKKSKVVKYLAQELRRKDSVIADLNKNNRLLLNTTLKQSQEIIDLKKRIYELYRK